MRMLEKYRNKNNIINNNNNNKHNYNNSDNSLTTRCIDGVKNH